MAELLILEFDDVDETDYLKVNAQLGLDPETGAGDWPEGLTTHLAGIGAGKGYVIEVWDSQAAQETFVQSRLGPAMEAGGLTSVPRVTWAPLVGHHTPVG